MKITAAYHCRYTAVPAYPNGASRHFQAKALDLLLAGAISLSLVTILLFLFILA